MNISKAMSICFENNIKVYPVRVGNNFMVCYVKKGEEKQFDKLVSKTEVNDAIAKTYIYLAGNV